MTGPRTKSSNVIGRCNAEIKVFLSSCEDVVVDGTIRVGRTLPTQRHIIADAETFREYVPHSSFGKTYKGRCRSKTAHQYCMCNVRTFGGGTVDVLTFVS